MKIKPNELSGMREVADMDDQNFGEVIRQAASAMGLPPAAISSAVANAPLLRQMLASASDSDLRKLASHIGDDKTAEILSKLKK